MPRVTITLIIKEKLKLCTLRNMKKQNHNVKNRLNKFLISSTILCKDKLKICIELLLSFWKNKTMIILDTNYNEYNFFT
jgi:hypothetical protein